MVNVSAGAQTDILAHVNTTLVVAEFGGESAAKLKLARIYLAAHFGTFALDDAAGTAGAITSEKAGDLSRDYGADSLAAAFDGSDYGATVHGQSFVALVRSTPARAPLLL
jgi:hypothetical protein